MLKIKTPYRSVLISLLAMALAPRVSMAGGPGSDPGLPMASSFPGPLWEVVTPGGGTASVANAHLVLNVPGGSNHDAVLPSNQAVRVVQPVGNYDFDVSIKIDSPIAATDAGTSRGLMVLADNENFLTFALVTDGTNLSLTAKLVTGGVAKEVFHQASFNEYRDPICLRLNRQASTYTAYYSVDQVVWSQVASFPDTQVPTLVGPFAGNYNQNPAKAVPVVMAINWFNVL
jgi:Beta xylosidase C-terminal Concanavalin A-like domain